MGRVRNSFFQTAAVVLATMFGVETNTGAATFTFREHLPQSYEVDFSPGVNSDSTGRWLEGKEAGENGRRVKIGHRLVLKTLPEATLSSLLEEHQLSLEEVVNDNLFICAASDALSAALAAESLASADNVVACYPIMRKEIELDNAYATRPNDYYYKLQAYHEARDGNGTPVGADINTRAAWPHTTGEGVIVGVADSGVQVEHPDLANQLAAGVQHNFSNDSDDGSSFALTPSWAHGISVAGLAVAEGNNEIGLIGAAPGAKLASWVIFDENYLLVGEDKLKELYTYRNDTVAVQNHSWGGGNVPTLVMPGLLELEGIDQAIANGRDGKGTILVRSGGNRRRDGGNANDSFYPSDPRVIGVAAVNSFGRVANYSVPGASLLVSAPGGESGDRFTMFTTDFLGSDGATSFRLWLPGEQDETIDTLWNYRHDFNPFVGTSAAAPLVSGVCAMMLSVNPDLTYRDVQMILALSARHIDLGDPDVKTNGAGFLVSHNQGFGVVDAGTAVQMAKGWVNQPAPINVVQTITSTQPIPDDGYRLVISGTGVPTSLNYITNRNSIGPIADDGTGMLPVVDVGLANGPIAVDLAGKAALIERGGSDYSVKIGHAADAGAVFAIVFNNTTGSSGCPGGDQLCPMGGTDFTTIPAVFIGNTQGIAIKTLLTEQTDTTAHLAMDKTRVEFPVANELLLRYAGVRLKTDHTLRGDLRITLVSPAGSRSILQRFNTDTSPGPVDWTDISTHHFGESAVGTWRLEISDHAEGFAGDLLEAGLILNGIPIPDSDADGLDDDWEQVHFAGLAALPEEDPDGDGYSNAREQLMRTDPRVEEIPFRVDMMLWNPDMARLSWPGREGASYELLGGTDVTQLNSVTNLSGEFPETVWFTPRTNLQQNFFLLRRTD